MTNKLEQDKQIIADAPKLAVGINRNGDYMFHGNYMFHGKGIRSLDDIRENIALQERVAELEKLNKTIESLMRSGERRGREKAKEKYSKALAQKDKRIAELEKENATLKHVEQIFNDSPDLTFETVQRLFEDELAKRDLEQQAKGIEDLIVWFEENCNKWGLAHSLENIAPNYAKKLREQAKGGDL